MNGEVVNNDQDDDSICDDDEISGCTDDEACNFNSSATDSNDNLCIYTDGICDTCINGIIIDNDQDNDGICNSEDTCIGTIDDCGICYDKYTKEKDTASDW